MDSDTREQIDEACHDGYQLAIETEWFVELIQDPWTDPLPLEYGGGGEAESIPHTLHNVWRLWARCFKHWQDPGLRKQFHLANDHPLYSRGEGYLCAFEAIKYQAYRIIQCAQGVFDLAQRSELGDPPPPVAELSVRTGELVQCLRKDPSRDGSPPPLGEKDLRIEALKEWQRMIDDLPHVIAAGQVDDGMRDGPVGKRNWRHNGRAVPGKLQQKSARLAIWLFNSKNKTATFADLADVFYGGDDSKLGNEPFARQRSDANKFFRDGGVPLKIEINRRDQQVSLRRG